MQFLTPPKMEKFMKNLFVGIFAACLSIYALTTQAQQKPKSDTKSGINTQQKTPTKIIEYIPGIWVIDHVYRGKEDVTNSDTLASMKKLEFNREGRYSSYSGTEKIDSGAYRINEEHAILYLASGNNGKPSEWNVRFDKSGNMTLSAKNTNKKEMAISYFYKKDSEASTSVR
jgi:hypothetical protein